AAHARALDVRAYRGAGGVDGCRRARRRGADDHGPPLHLALRGPAAEVTRPPSTPSAAPGDVVAQRGEPLVPARPEVGHPGDGVGERPGRDLEELLPPAAGGGDEPRVGQRAEVLRDRLPGDGQVGGETGGGRGPLLRERADHLPPRRVGERREDRIGAIALHASIAASAPSAARDCSGVRSDKTGCRTPRTRAPSVPASSMISTRVGGTRTTSPWAVRWNGSQRNASRRSGSIASTTAARSVPSAQRNTPRPPGRAS